MCIVGTKLAHPHANLAGGGGSFIRWHHHFGAVTSLGGSASCNIPKIWDNFLLLLSIIAIELNIEIIREKTK